MKSIQKNRFALLVAVAITILGLATPSIANASSNELSCPFTHDNENQWVISNLSNSRLLSEFNKNPNKETTPESVNLPAGKYDITLFTGDTYDGRETMTQPHEQAYLSLRDDNGNEIATTGFSGDLDDERKTATETTSFSDVDVTQAIKQVAGVHAYFNSTSSSNSVEVVCAKFEKEPEPDPVLEGSCNVSPKIIEIGDSLDWSASANGGTGNYTYQWSGDVSASSKNTTKTYSSPGTKTATVTISSGDQDTKATCQALVEEDEEEEDDPDEDDSTETFGTGGSVMDGRSRSSISTKENIAVECVTDTDRVEIGEEVEFKADVSGDDDVKYTWSADGETLGDKDSLTHTFYTSGSQTVTVEVETDRQSDRDSCEVEVSQPEVLGATTEQVTLDSVPYTGASDTLKLLLFILVILASSSIVGYLGVKRFTVNSPQPHQINT